MLVACSTKPLLQTIRKSVKEGSFTVFELKLLKRVPELLIRDYDEPEVIEFAEEPYGLCVEAVNTNRLVFTLGD